MKILLSIKPVFVEEIFKGDKKFEYRRTIFKRKDIKKVVVCNKTRRKNSR